MERLFWVKPEELKSDSRLFAGVSEKNSVFQQEIDNVASELDASLSDVIPSLNAISGRVRDNSTRLTLFSESLDQIATCYLQAEENVVDNQTAKAVSYKATSGSGNGSLNTVDPNLGVDDPRGVRYGLEDEKFLEITDENGNVIGYGGDQGWFKDDPDLRTMGIDIDGYGCGIIAAVNQILYMSGVRSISKDDYMDLVREFFDEGFLRKYGVNHGFLLSGKGAIPTQLANFIRDECAERGIKVDPHWDYCGNDYEGRYEYMKEAVQNGKPVMWGIHDNDGDTCPFYSYDESTGKLEKTNGCSSHYVTVTGVYEKVGPNGNVERLVEVSSWGEKYYVKWDEYMEFMDIKIKDGNIFQQGIEFIEDFLGNYIGSSVMVI